tara:strand:- start:6149 stop:6382 length:234 start_codon:yes stop_codon:yes gene_type:complete
VCRPLGFVSAQPQLPLAFATGIDYLGLRTWLRCYLVSLVAFMNTSLLKGICFVPTVSTGFHPHIDDGLPIAQAAPRG